VILLPCQLRCRIRSATVVTASLSSPHHDLLFDVWVDRQNIILSVMHHGGVLFFCAFSGGPTIYHWYYTHLLFTSKKPKSISIILINQLWQNLWQTFLKMTAAAICCCWLLEEESKKNLKLIQLLVSFAIACFW